MSDNWTVKNIYYLATLTVAYIIGEIAHFLINTTAREVADRSNEIFSEFSCMFRLQEKYILVMRSVILTPV